MEVWNDEAPNAHTTVDDTDYTDYTDTQQYDVPAEEAIPEVTDPNLDPNFGMSDVYREENAQPDEFGDVYASDGTYIGNVFLTPEMNQAATTGGELPEGATIDQTTGDILDENGNVIGNLGDSGTGYVDLGTINQGPREDVTIDDNGDIYDKDGNYVGNSADSFIDEYGNVFDAKGNYVGMTSPANANLSSAASVAARPSSVGNIVPRGGPGASGGGAGGASGGGGAGGGSGLSLSPKQSAPAASPTTSKTQAKVLVQQVKSGTSLIKIYSDGSREVVANYYAPTIQTPVPQVAKISPTVVTRPGTGITGGNGLQASAVNAGLNERDFLAALFGNLNKGNQGPGSGNVSMKGYNPSTQLTPSGQPRVSGGRTAGSTAPKSTVNTLIAGSRPGQQGNAQVNAPQTDITGGTLSTGMGGIAALAIGAVALFAVAS